MATVTQNRKGKAVAGVPCFEASSGSSVVPKYTKIDVPRFNGQDDPFGWLNCFEHVFHHQQTSKEGKVRLAFIQLKGNAQRWYVQLETGLPNLSWEKFKKQCHLCFGPPIRAHKFNELTKLR